MKKYIINAILITILFILVIGIPHITLADDSKVNTKIYEDGFINDFDPNKEVGENQAVGAVEKPIINAIVNVINPILGTIQVIGGLVAVLSIAFYGFKHILGADPGMSRDLGMPTNDRGSPNMRIELHNWARVMIIGSILLFFSSTLMKIVFNMLMSTNG